MGAAVAEASLTKVGSASARTAAGAAPTQSAQWAGHGGGTEGVARGIRSAQKKRSKV